MLSAMPIPFVVGCHFPVVLPSLFLLSRTTRLSSLSIRSVNCVLVPASSLASDPGKTHPSEPRCMSLALSLSESFVFLGYTSSPWTIAVSLSRGSINCACTRLCSAHGCACNDRVLDTRFVPGWQPLCGKSVFLVGFFTLSFLCRSC